MKKLYSILAAGAIALSTAFSASAANGDYYVSGDFNGWPHVGNDSYILKKNGTIYTLDLTTTATPDLTAGKFLIVMNNNGNPDWNNKFGGPTNITEGQTVTMSKGGGDMTVKNTIANALITWDSSTNKLTITGQTKENDYSVLYVVGDINDSGWNTNQTNYVLNPKADDPTTFEGTFSFTKGSSGTSNNYVKIKAGDLIYGTQSNDVNVVMGTEYTIYQSQGDSYVVGTGEFSFSVKLDKNAAQGKLTITGSGSEAEKNYGNWWVAAFGAFNGGSTDANQTQPTANGIATLSNLALGNSTFEIKVWDTVEDTYYNFASAPIKPGVATTLTNVANSKLSIEGSKEGDEYTLVFNCATNELTVTRTKEGDGEVVDPVVDYTTWTVNICGPWNSDTTYGDGSVYANPKADGVVAFTGCTGLEQGFQIKTWDNQADGWFNQTASPVVPGNWTPVTNNYGSYIYIQDAVEGQEYTVEFNCADNTVKVTLTKDVQGTPEPGPVEVTYDFTSFDKIQSYNSSIPSSDGWAVDSGTNKFYNVEGQDFVTEGFTLTTTSNNQTGNKGPRLYNYGTTSYDLRIANTGDASGSITITAPQDCYLTKIVFNCSASANSSINKLTEASTGEITVTTTGGKYATWVPAEGQKVSTVTVTATGSSTRIGTIVISAEVSEGEEPEVQAPVLTVQEDKEVGVDGKYDGPVTVTLTSDGDDDEIFYSLDGTEPSIAYTEPIKIDQDATLKAKAIRNGNVESELFSKDYSISTTGIVEVGAEGVNAPVEYYNLQGVRIANPAPGQVVIVRQGNEVKKVLVK